MKRANKARGKRQEARGNGPDGKGDAHITPRLRPLAVAIHTLTSDPGNVRRHGDRNLAAIAASLTKFGQQAPCVYVVRGDRHIVIKGNGLLAAARSLKWTHLAAVESDLAGHDITAYAIADNRTTDLSEFDLEGLAAQIQELEQEDFDLATLGFNEEEMTELLRSVEDSRPAAGDGDGTPRKRGERTALFLAGHLKFEIPRAAFDRWLTSVEAKVGNDPDKIVREIKRRLRLGEASGG